MFENVCPFPSSLKGISLECQILRSCFLSLRRSFVCTAPLFFHTDDRGREAWGQPDISSPWKQFVSSAQIPGQTFSLIRSQHLNKDMSWGWESISKLPGIHHTLSIHRWHFYCISGNSLSRYGIHLLIALLSLAIWRTLVLSSWSIFILHHVLAFLKLLLFASTGTVSSMTIFYLATSILSAPCYS